MNAAGLSVPVKKYRVPLYALHSSKYSKLLNEVDFTLGVVQIEKSQLHFLKVSHN